MEVQGARRAKGPDSRTAQGVLEPNSRVGSRARPERRRAGEARKSGRRNGLDESAKIRQDYEDPEVRPFALAYGANWASLRALPFRVNCDRP